MFGVTVMVRVNTKKRRMAESGIDFAKTCGQRLPGEDIL